MAERRPKVTVFGAGMIGIYLGGLLSRHADVTFVGRASMLDPLKGGLRLTDVDGLDLELGTDAFRTTTDPAGLAGADLVLVTVKSLATPEAAQAVRVHAPPEALVISFQNGVSNAEILSAALPGRIVLAGMVPFNVAQRSPTHLHRGTGGSLAVADHPALAPFEGPFAAAGIPLHRQTNMAGVMWGKLLVNLNNAINALSGVSLAEELRQRDFRRAWALSLEEGLKLVKAAGIHPVDPLPMPLKLMPQIMRLPDALYRYVVAAGSGGNVRVDPHARSSMADDLARGRPTEVDFLQGEVVRLAERLGRRAPVNARLVEMVKEAEMEATRWKAGSLFRELARLRGS